MFATISSMRRSDTWPIDASGGRSALLSVDTCDALTTLGRGRFASPALSSTFQRAEARRRLEVTAHTTTVRIALALTTSLETTTTGR